MYVVTMYRYADREKHSYILDIFSKPEIAKGEAQKEKEHRGGNKYFPEILEFDIDNIMSEKVLLKLEKNE